LADLGPGEDQTRDKANNDGSDTAEGDGSIEEDEARDGDGQLVESADHGIGGRRGDADAPGRAVRDKDGGQTGVYHANHQLVTRLLREVARQVLGRPVLDEQRADDQDGDGEQIVVEHGYISLVLTLTHLPSGAPTVIVLKVHLLNDLAHAENIRRSAHNVHAHPRVAGIESRQGARGIERVHAIKSGLNISPGSNDGAEHHQTEREKGQGSDAAAEPENFAVGDHDDGQVLEDGVDGNREVLQRLGASVDHANEEQRDREP
jgi:hypothetical protein